MPNGGFELTAACPNGTGQLYLASPWDSLNANPDLFNSCAPSTVLCNSVNVPLNFASNATSHSGNGYAGFTAMNSNPGYREYLQSPLLQPLLPGKIYKVEIWLRRASYCNAAVGTLGITLSAGPLTQNGTSNLGFPPQVETTTAITDDDEWTLLRDYIVAFGGENNICIGNFRNDAASGMVVQQNSGAACPLNGAYYFVDDVRIELITESVNITGDSIICPNTPTTLFANANTPTYWSLAPDPATPISTATSLTVNPAVNTTYYLNGIFYSDSITIQVIQPPIVNLGNDTTICEEHFVLLNAENQGATYLWSTGAISPAIQVFETGEYGVQVDNGGCTAGDTVHVNVLSNPPIDLGTDTIYCSLLNDFIVLDAGTGVSYQWLPNAEISQTIMVTAPGEYSVVVTFLNGCTKDTSINIKEICDAVVFVPRCFTPNDDGVNDILMPAGYSITSIQMQVFNRWGSIVFQSESPDNGWDGKVRGKKAPDGIYTFILRYTYEAMGGQVMEGSMSGVTSIIR